MSTASAGSEPAPPASPFYTTPHHTTPHDMTRYAHDRDAIVDPVVLTCANRTATVTDTTPLHRVQPPRTPPGFEVGTKLDSVDEMKKKWEEFKRKQVWA